MNAAMLFPQDAEFCVDGALSEARFRLPSDFPYFEGHFPDTPVVPGVAQVGWVLRVGGPLGVDLLATVSRYRFVKPIGPGQSIRVRVERSAKGFACQVFADEELASKGTLIQPPA